MMRYCLVAVVLVMGMGGTTLAQAPEKTLVDKVRKSIEDGKRFLHEQQIISGDEGHWERQLAAKQHPGGWTALALLALLNAGEKPEAPVIQRGLKYLRQLPPLETYVVGLQTMVFMEAGEARDLLRIQRNVDWLIGARVMAGKDLLGWGYRSGGRSTDNSNSQYALLGLWAGKAAGAKIDREIWESIRDFYTRTQEKEGGWSYSSGPRTSVTMTTAGLCGLLIAGMELSTAKQILNADGTAQNCGVYEENQPVARATGWISRNFTIELPGHTFYNIYGIERAGRLSGQRFFGEHDWYRAGCEFLVRSQRDDGSWYVSRQVSDFDQWPVVSTSFSLLFLSKGRTPVLVSKLVHGSPDNPSVDWNNKHNDLRNLTDYCSKNLFKRQPLAWQVFNARSLGQDRNRQQLLELAGELLQAPIAFFSGHRRPIFTGWEKELLKEYVEQGGFILAEACCGSKDFDAGFRTLMKELFPQTPLKPLPANHPIWTAHAPPVLPTDFKLEGIELGCKTVVVYSPQPLAGWWEANQFDRGQGEAAFRLGKNIVAYATGLELPKPKGFHIDVVDSKVDTKVPRGYLKVAQVRQGERWRSAGQAVRNLMLDLRKNARIDAALDTQDLHPSDKDLLNFKFMYMHGRDEFEIADPAVLRANLETGGLLFADACCGKKDFDKAFRKFVARLFPDQPLERIPVTDDLFSKELNGSGIASVRCRTERADGGPEADFGNMPPFLEGIKIKDRWVVIYSKYDIGCALEKHQSPDCLGHDHESALKLGSAAVLYALLR